MVPKFSFALLVDVVDTEQCACEGGCFSEGYKERGVDLALWVYKDSAKEQNQASDGEYKC